MLYYSLNHQSPDVSFQEATIRGQAPDKGLYFPRQIPVVDPVLLRDIESLPDEEIAFRVMQPYVGEEMPERALRQILQETVPFPIPLVPVSPNIYSLELYHGPTLAFKDVGARFMSRCLARFSGERKEKLTILVATSGDTGGAVASGFYDVPGVEVIILYPSGKVSRVQEKQLTTLGKNIHALEVEGSFDDCQQMVKQAFADESLSSMRFLTSANSINIARWLPQQIYYFLAYKQWKAKEMPPVFSVPSGNFGNICAGILAHISGLPVAHFVAACNANDVVTRFLSTQQYQPRKAVATISNAMDVGDPSNFVRILELFQHRFAELKKKLSSVSISDEETRQTIKRIWEARHYLLDPHGAVGYLALERYLSQHSGTAGIFLETAHPVKFFDVVEPVTGSAVILPETVSTLMNLPGKSTRISSEYAHLKEFLLA